MDRARSVASRADGLRRTSRVDAAAAQSVRTARVRVTRHRPVGGAALLGGIHATTSRRTCRRPALRRIPVGARGLPIVCIKPKDNGRSQAMSDIPTQMGAEAREAPAVLARQAAALASPVAELTPLLRRRSARLVVPCARGRRAPAATFGKHLIERHLGIPVSAAAPNVASVYRRALALDGQLFLAISQAGRSVDIVETAAMARSSGAMTVAIVNDTASPLAQTCDVVLPMEAGPELSVAATKSFIASLAVLLRLTAAWADNATMQRSVDALPERLAAAIELDWSAAIGSLANARSVMTIGR